MLFNVCLNVHEDMEESIQFPVATDAMPNMT
jgi:hypothetical protein